ncbi:MAG TPA: ABC transporter substrate-binding protein [Solirubrobacteraceae bacterium]|nr:ABC transporter substrate-binding protein [Solirubrobacteraceae bacterium]
MKSGTKTLAMVAAICGLVLALAACGSSGNNNSTSSSGSGSTSTSSSSGPKPAQDGSGQTITGGTKGGVLNVVQHEDFQHLDPGESYFSLDYEVIYPTQLTLYLFPPNNSTSVIPNLAAALPTITDGGRTVTVHIRHGVKFSPPVNREVTSADVAYAIERGANPNVANPYFPAYFNYIVGASKANGGPISGISTPDKYTIVFHLTGTYGSFFEGALSLPLSAPVPKDFAAPLDAKKPTAYGSTYLADTGPYMIKADPKTGKFIGIGYQPGKSATLVRNPNWNPNLGLPQPAYLDQININIGGDPNVIGRQVLQGSHLVSGDTPSNTIVKLAYQNYYNQFFAVPGAAINYVALNNAKGPFANVNVRKAYWAALDREAMVKVAGGTIVGAVATHFIYPGSAGYQQAGGDAGPQVDYNMYPQGNMTVAEKYMKLAGYPSGKYTGSAVIKVVGSTGDPAPQEAAIANQAALALGFKTNFNTVDQPVMYGKYCGVPKAEIDVCPNVGWIRDWADPQTLLDPTFAGYNIVTTNNSNWSQANWQDGPYGPHPGKATTPIDIAMKAAEGTVGDSARAAAWAKVDQMLVADAVAAPWNFVKQPQIESKDVNGILDLWNVGSFDYAWTWLK